MKLRVSYAFLTMCVLSVINCGSPVPAGMREITDMAGRKVLVPGVINRAVAPSPYGSTMLYSVAPEKTVGLMGAVNQEDKKFLNPVVHDLPPVGRISKMDSILKAEPEVIIVWGAKESPVHQRSEDALKDIKIPHVYVCVGELANLYDYPAAYEFMGMLLGKEDHAAKEAEYCRKTLAEVEAVMKSIPKDKIPRVYLAEGPDGLRTECDDSLHVHLFRLVGDVNIFRCHTSCHKGFEKVTIEQVKEHDPQVIIVQDRKFYDRIFTDPAWKNISAVKEKRVYLTPKKPFNWFDRPPSFMRILGLKWVMKCLYPDDCKIDLVKETRDFFSLFLSVDISDKDAKSVINP